MRLDWLHKIMTIILIISIVIGSFTLLYGVGHMILWVMK